MYFNTMITFKGPKVFFYNINRKKIQIVLKEVSISFLLPHTIVLWNIRHLQGNEKYQL